MDFRNIDTDKALAFTLLLIASLMVIEARTFRADVATFPRFTGIVVIAGSLLVLLQDYLPGPLQRLVADTSALVEADEELKGKFEESAAQQKQEQQESTILGINKPLATFILLSGYIGGSYLIGFLFMSPIFVAAYAILTNQSWVVVFITTCLGFLIPYLFMIFLNIPVNDGVFGGALPW